VIELEITVDVNGRKFGASNREPAAGYDRAYNIDLAIRLLDQEVEAIKKAMEAQK
jgi:hypothetical protein